MANLASLRNHRSRSAWKLLGPLATGLAVLAAAPDALAWDDFPGYLQDTLQTDCAPTCLLCHTSPEGGRDHLKGNGGTDIGGVRGAGVFVTNLIYHQDRAQPISGQKEQPSQAALAAALLSLETTDCTDAGDGPCDSDGDGKPDIAELRENLDPENASPDAALCIGPRYGCGAHVAPAKPAPTQWGALVAALGVALVLVRRARRA